MEQSNQRLHKIILAYKLRDRPKINDEIFKYHCIGDWNAAYDSEENFRLTPTYSSEEPSRIIRQGTRITLLENELRIMLSDTGIYPIENDAHSVGMFATLNDYLVNKRDLHAYIAQNQENKEILTFSRKQPKCLGMVIKIPMYWE